MSEKHKLKPIFRYPGSKWSLLPTFIPLMPRHEIDVYVSVFGGSGTDILAIDPYEFEVFNDSNEHIVNVFDVIKSDDHLTELLNRIRTTIPSPVITFQDALNTLSCVKSGQTVIDRVKWAWAYIVLARLGRCHCAPELMTKSSCSFKKKNKKNKKKEEKAIYAALQNLADRIEAAAVRFRNVLTTSDDWRKCIERFDGPGTFFFLDPPYHPDKVKRKLYSHIMTPKDHEDMLDFLNGLKGYAMLCGYPCAPYYDKLPHWHSRGYPRRTSLPGKKRPPRHEVIWTNYPPDALEPHQNTSPSTSTSDSRKPISVASTDPKDWLDEYEDLRTLVHDYVGGVAHGYQTGLYLVGRPGTGKTFTVKEAIEEMDVPYVYRNGRMTAKAFFDLLENHPQHTIVIDDITELFQTVHARQLLLAALDGKAGEPRDVCYNRDKVNKTLKFSGGFIAISNLTLGDDPVLAALKSRIVPLKFEPADEHIVALMRHLADDGYEGLTAEQCHEVVDFLVAETKDSECRLDLRHFDKARNIYRQWLDNKTIHDWKDLVRTVLQQQALLSTTTSKQSGKERELEIVLELYRKYEERDQSQQRIAEWKERTGRSRATFFRRRDLLVEEGRLEL